MPCLYIDSTLLKSYFHTENQLMPTKIIPQTRLAEKRAKLEATRIDLAEKERNKERYAKLHLLNAEKNTAELEMTEVKLAHFDVLNTPSRDLNPKQLSERLNAQSIVKINEAKLLSIRAKTTKIINPTWFVEEVVAPVHSLNLVLTTPDENIPNHTPSDCDSDSSDEPAQPEETEENPQEKAEQTDTEEKVEPNPVTFKHLEVSMGNTTEIHIREECVGMVECRNGESEIPEKVFEIPTEKVEPKPIEEQSDEKNPEPDHEQPKLTEKQVHQITSIAEAMDALNEIKQRDLLETAGSHIYYIESHLHAECIAPHTKNMNHVQHHSGSLEDVELAEETTALFLIEPVDTTPDTKDTPELQPPSRIIHLATEADVQKILLEMTAEVDKPTSDALTTYCIGQQLFENHVLDFVDTWGYEEIQEHIGSLETVQLVPNIKFLFVIEPTSPDIYSLNAKVIIALKDWERDGCVDGSTTHGDLLESIRQHLISENPDDELSISGSVIEVTHNKTGQLAVVSICYEDGDDGSKTTLYSTVYNRTGQNQKTVRKQYIRRGSAESYMKKFLGK